MRADVRGRSLNAPFMKAPLDLDAYKTIEIIRGTDHPARVDRIVGFRHALVFGIGGCDCAAWRQIAVPRKISHFDGD